MNCKKCKYRIVNVVGHNPNNEPYKYSCAKNAFFSLTSTHEKGKSYYCKETSSVYYTDNQLDWYIQENLGKMCNSKLGFTTATKWSLGISILALLVSGIFSFLGYTKNVEQIRYEQKQLISSQVDSIIDIRFVEVNDSIKTIEKSLRYIDIQKNDSLTNLIKSLILKELNHKETNPIKKDSNNLLTSSNS